MRQLKILLFLGLVIFLCSSLFAKDPLVHTWLKDKGIYFSKVIERFGYKVDTKAQLCFAFTLMEKDESKDFYGNPQNAGMILENVSCKNLAKRPEWKEIITWEK